MEKVVTLLFLMLLMENWKQVKAFLGNETDLCLGDRLHIQCQSNTNGAQVTVCSNMFLTQCHDRFFTSVMQTSEPIAINGTNITFRASPESSNSSIVLDIQVDSVTAQLNDTNITCSNIFGILKTTIIAVNEDAPAPTPFATVSEIFTTEQVSVTLEWIPHDGVAYSVGITGGRTVPITVIGHATAHLNVTYNTHYNVNIVAKRCSENSTSLTQLHYAECGYPIGLPMTAVVFGYSSPALAGTNITITYPETNTSQIITCMDNGEWNLSKNKESTDSETKDSKNDSISIIGGALGAGLICIIAIIVVIIIVIVAAVFKKDKRCSSETTSISDSAHTYVQYQAQDQRENMQPIEGQYSLVQLVEQQSKPDSSNQQQPCGELQQGLVYADIGPLSCKRPPRVCISNLDDDRVEYAQLSVQKVSEAKKEISVHVTSDSTVADNLLNLDNLLIVIKSQVTPHWYEFGKIIGVQEKMLEKCLHYPSEDSIIEVCDNWLRTHTGKPSWREVSEALKQINCEQLAYDVEHIYKTGELVTVADGEEPELPPPLPPKMA